MLILTMGYSVLLIKIQDSQQVCPVNRGCLLILGTCVYLWCFQGYLFVISNFLFEFKNTLQLNIKQSIYNPWFFFSNSPLCVELKCTCTSKRIANSTKLRFSPLYLHVHGGKFNISLRDPQCASFNIEYMHARFNVVPHNYIYLSIYLSIDLSIFLSIYLSFCLTIFLYI